MDTLLILCTQYSRVQQKFIMTLYCLHFEGYFKLDNMKLTTCQQTSLIIIVYIYNSVRINSNCLFLYFIVSCLCFANMNLGKYH